MVERLLENLLTLDTKDLAISRCNTRKQADVLTVVFISPDLVTDFY